MTKLVEPRILKGFRDFLPAESIGRQYIASNLRRTFESYGFDPIETPALEYLDIFQGSIGADEKLFYQFRDHGGREVALRYEQTVPTCRFVAQHKHELTMPFKRYQIQSVWRADKPQKGRYREFIQCDFDIFGISDAVADAETIALTLSSYLNLGFQEITVQVSDRELYKALNLDYPIIVAVDKLHKIGASGVITEIVEAGRSQPEAESILESIFALQPNDRLKRIFDYLSLSGFDERHFVFEPTMARSFNYSTGPIWEVKAPGYDVGSLGGGERYDALVNRFVKEPVPATGIGLGFDRTYDAMVALGILPEKRTYADVLITVFEDTRESLGEALKLGAKLRKSGLNVEVYTDPAVKLGKQLSYADAKGISYALIVGPDEVKQGTCTIKSLVDRTQVSVLSSAAATWLRERIAE